jgi:rSAM/selenodomain-associated transferase 2
MRSISVLIPVLNDATALRRLLDRLEALVSESIIGCEIVVIDGGSTDGSQNVCAERDCLVIQSAGGRGRQLQAGFEASSGDLIWMLHADTDPDSEALKYLVTLDAPAWGRFDVRFADGPPFLSVVATLMNWRSRMTGIATGDQAIFAHRSLLEAIGGVPRQALMEDIELSKRLKSRMRPLCSRHIVETSGRRWEARGVIRTILSMWRFRLRYWIGADPERLAAEYYS